jgi:predicted dehydrogenase
LKFTYPGQKDNFTLGGNMTITPVILGSGRSGDAIAKSFAILNIMRPELKIMSPVRLERGASLVEEKNKYTNSLLCIANPHGLHADAILEADRAGYAGILCEKPACVNLDQLQALRSVKTPTAILHVYRQMWGIQTIKKMMLENKFGEIISIEGRYWQASTAERALTPGSKGWKDDPKLTGDYDTYLDIGTHWVDAVNYLLGGVPDRISGWRSFTNAVSLHRDSHVHLTMNYPKTRALGSISKTIHGATNHFEINIIGSRLAATWKFQEPDEIFIGEGRERRVLTRKDSELGSKQPPHHGMGWLEGYIEIANALVDDINQQGQKNYPTLTENLNTLEVMLKARWEN